MKDKIFIVCGYGNIGRKVCQSLQQKYNPYIIVIDINLLNIERIFEDGFDGYEGDASGTQVLLEAGIKHAYGIICTFSDDDLNALCIISAKWLNPEIQVISRVNKSQSVKKLKLAGAYKVISFPKMKNRFLKLPVNRFKIDLLVSSLASFERDLYISEIQIEAHSFLHNKQLNSVKNIADVDIIGLKRNDETFISNPSIYELIRKKDTIILLAEKERIQYLREKIKYLSFYHFIGKIIEKAFVKRLTIYWIAILISFNYFVLFDDFLNWIVLPAPPFTMGHFVFAFSSLFFGLLLLYISWKIDKKHRKYNNWNDFKIFLNGF